MLHLVRNVTPNVTVRIQRLQYLTKESVTFVTGYTKLKNKIKIKKYFKK